MAPSLAAAVAVAMLRVLCYVFANKFPLQPYFNLEPDYIIRKPIVHRIQRYILHREILSTFHTRVDHRSVRHFTTVNNRTKISKNARNHARNSPFPLRYVDFHLTHECLGPPHSPRSIVIRTFTQTTQQSPHWLQWDAANSPQTAPSPSTITIKI